MLNRVKGKRAAIGALGVALAAMLAVGVALGVGQRGDGPPTTWVTGVIGDGSHGTIAADEPFGPGNYRMLLGEIGLPEVIGEDKSLVFTVPPGMRIELGGWFVGSCWRCPPQMWFHGDGGENGAFTFCLDLETGAECGRGYAATVAGLGEPIDEYGRPLHVSAEDEARAKRLEPLIDKVVASARIESAR